MATHFVYEDPNKTELYQGDILRRADGLVGLLGDYFPYYLNHPDYTYFMVLTQTCDLVRRDGKECSAPYISIAAVRPIEDILRMEAAGHQHPALRKTKVIGNDARRKLAMFLESLMDNNKPGLFYLHEDQTIGIMEPCCAFLQLSITLRSEHYDKCLDAKITQLKEPFQAKLGWLIGNMYSRVATTEWNTEKPAEKVGRVASTILGRAFLNRDDERIRVSMDELADAGTIETKSAEELVAYIDAKKMLPKLRQFKEKAVEIVSGMRVVDPVKARIVTMIRQDDELKKGVSALFAEMGADDPDAKATDVIRLLGSKIRDAINEETFPKRDEYIAGLVSDLMADKILQSMIKS